MSDEQTSATGVETGSRATLAQAVEGVQPTLSAADILRQGFEKARTSRPLKHVQVYGYGEPASELWVTFRCLTDYKEIRDNMQDVVRSMPKDAAGREIGVALATMANAAVGSYAVVGDNTIQIGEPLGLGLYNYLFPDQPGPTNDNEAIIRIFNDNTALIATIGIEIDQWMRAGGPGDEQAERDVLGESKAA